MDWLWLLPVVVIACVAYKLWQQRKKNNELKSAREELDRYYRDRPGIPLKSKGRVPTSSSHPSADTTPARQEDDWGQRHDRKRNDDNSMPWFAAWGLMGESSSPNDSANTHSHSVAASDNDSGFHTGGGFGGGDYSSGDSSGSDSSSDSGSSDSGGGDSGGGGGD